MMQPCSCAARRLCKLQQPLTAVAPSEQDQQHSLTPMSHHGVQGTVTSVNLILDAGCHLRGISIELQKHLLTHNHKTAFAQVALLKSSTWRRT